MAKYLIHANYVGEGMQGLLKEGGTSRRAAVEQLMTSMGGTVESFYYAFGDTALYVIVDAPDNVSMAAASLMLNATGVVTVSTTVLITPEEIDAAVKKTPSYRAPGQ
jgi:uncharacterized protein with GYD domain